MMSQIDSRHWTISTDRHFQNGRHNTTKIQHCPISSKFDMWVDNDVPNVLWWPFWKWWPVEIFQCRKSIRGIIIYPHIKFWWYRTMLNFYRPYFMPCFSSHFENGRQIIQHCPISSKFDMWVDNDVLNWLPTLKNLYRSPFSKWPPQYRKNSTMYEISSFP
jgi:hypothetical protein